MYLHPAKYNTIKVFMMNRNTVSLQQPDITQFIC